MEPNISTSEFTQSNILGGEVPIFDDQIVQIQPQYLDESLINL